MRVQCAECGGRRQRTLLNGEAHQWIWHRRDSGHDADIPLRDPSDRPTWLSHGNNPDRDADRTADRRRCAYSFIWQFQYSLGLPHTATLAVRLYALIPFAFIATAPESPVWLFRQQKYEAAVRSIRRLSQKGADARNIATKQQRAIEEEQEKARTTNTSFIGCFKGTERRRTLIVLLAYSSPKLWGLTLLANASYFLEVQGLAEELALVV